MMQGLSISVVGIIITFFSLGVFILIMIVLQRIFPAKVKNKKEVEEIVPAVENMLDQGYRVEEEEQAIVAAIMVAIDHFETTSQPALGTNLEAGRGRWWMTNRISARQTIVMKKN
jgi:hypothetical protein